MRNVLDNNNNDMITRQQYMDNEATHEAYYEQFVTPEIYDEVKTKIGEALIKASTDEHFNDIPLGRWDRLGMQSVNSTRLHEAVKATGDFVSLAVLVCVAKAAARMIKEGRQPL